MVADGCHSSLRGRIIKDREHSLHLAWLLLSYKDYVVTAMVNPLL